MPRKIKVVNVAQMEVGSEPVVEIPNEPTPSELASNASTSSSLAPKVEEEPLAIQNEELKPEVVQSEDEIKVESNEKELKQNKSQTGTCDLCGKTMLLKNLKYAHPKVCKNKPPTPAPPPPPTPNIIIERVVVNSAPAPAPATETPKAPEQQHQEQKQTRTEIRKQRITSLIANAF